jgi:hypothetical protein
MIVRVYRIIALLALPGFSVGCATKPIAAASKPAEVEAEVVKVGENVTLVVESDGTPPLTFRWEKNGQRSPAPTARRW